MMLRRAIISLLLIFVLLPLKAQLNTDRIMLIGRNALYFEDYVLSIQYFNKVIESKPFLHEPYFFRGLAKYYLDDYRGAEEDLDKAIEKNPYVSRSYQLRGMCRAKRDSVNGAMSDFRMAIKYDPQNPLLWQNLAAAAAQGKRWDEAAGVVDSLLLFAPRYTTGYLMRVHIAMELGDSATAVGMADEAVKSDAYSSDVYEMRAIVNAEYGHYGVAEEDITRAIELMPGRCGSYLNRALIRYHQNNLRGAMEDYDMALYVEPASFVGHYNRGLLRMQVGDDNRAIEDFDFVLGIDEDNTMARFNRALLRDQTGDLRGAVEDYTRVLADFPSFEYGYRCRAAALRKLGDVKAAEKDEVWLLQRMTAGITGQSGSADDDEPRGKTRERSDRNVRNYNKMIASERGFDKDYTTEYRGKVQNRNSVVELEPLFVLTYYEDDKELRTAGYYRPVEEMNKNSLLPYKVVLTNNERALASNEVERHFASIDALSKDIDEHPEDIYIRLSRAVDYYLVQDLDAAINDLDVALTLEGELWSIYFARAFVRYKILEGQRLADMNSTAGVAVKRDAGLPNMEYRIIKGDFDKVVALMPDFPQAFFNRGNVQVKLNDFKSAVVDYSEAIRLDDRFAEAYYNRGLAYLYLGNTEEAIADLSKAGELGIFSAYNVIKRYKEQGEQ